MDITETLVEHHVELVDQLLEHAAGLDDQTLDAVHPAPPGALDDDASARTLLTMLVAQLEVWLALAEGKQSVELTGLSLAELGRRHREAGLQFVELTRSVVRERRAAEVFRPGSGEHPEVFNYGGMIAHVLTFGAARRTMVVGILQDAGVEGLRYGDPLLYFADRAH
jgi:AraC family transcriptional regulator